VPHEEATNASGTLPARVKGQQIKSADPRYRQMRGIDDEWERVGTIIHIPSYSMHIMCTARAQHLLITIDWKLQSMFHSRHLTFCPPHCISLPWDIQIYLHNIFWTTLKINLNSWKYTKRYAPWGSFLNVLTSSGVLPPFFSVTPELGKLAVRVNEKSLNLPNSVMYFQGSL